jgi:methylglutaconyl-CoA hydratase
VSPGEYRNLRLALHGAGAGGGAVLRVTLSRPEVRNAFDDVLIEELTRAFAGAREDPGVRVVVLAGEGPTFCAGADVHWMRKAGGYSQAENQADAERMARMLRTIDACPKPVIALAHGAAIGGGVGLVAAADIAIASEETVFSLAEVRLGILPAVVSPFVLRAIGPRAARDLFLTGDRFDAREAHRIGLVHQVVAAGDLAAAGDRKVASLLASGPEAIGVAKRLIAEVAWKSPEEVAARTVGAISERRASAEAKEGLTAFLEKRKPSWAGESRPARGERE